MNEDEVRREFETVLSDPGTRRLVDQLRETFPVGPDFVDEPIDDTARVAIADKIVEHVFPSQGERPLKAQALSTGLLARYLYTLVVAGHAPDPVQFLRQVAWETLGYPSEAMPPTTSTSSRRGRKRNFSMRTFVTERIAAGYELRDVAGELVDAFPESFGGCDEETALRRAGSRVKYYLQNTA